MSSAGEPIVEIGVHATKPGANGLVIFLRAKELDHVQGVPQRGGSLSVGDVLATGPAADGFGIFMPGYYRYQPLAEEFLEGGGVAAMPWYPTGINLDPGPAV